MSNLKYLLSLTFSFIFLLASAQNVESFELASLKTVNFSNLQSSFSAKVYSIEAPYPGSDTYRNYLHQLKSLRYGNPSTLKSQTKSIKKITSNQAPIVDLGFPGNTFGGIPNDNDIAISNGGQVVSVSNTDVFIYDEEGTLLLNFDLANLADSLDLVANSYDPKIVYDPLADKFILAFLNGSSAPSTDIIVCFSQTNDATQQWNVYNLPGNPFNNNAWSDFPMIALTETDFFVTVNHINSDSASWQTGFMQSVIWQVSTAQGYANQNIVSKVHSNVAYNGSLLRNLLPIKGGFDLKANEMYFVSNRNFDFENDTFFLVKISESLYQNPNPSFTIQALVANQSYGVPPDAKQTATTFLQTNDARALSGFIENGTIHFTGNTVNFATDLAAIYHGKINILASSPSVDLTILSDTVLEYGYPNLSFSGQTPFDEQAIISFNHTSIDSFPGVSAIFYSDDAGYSERLHLVSGTSKVNVISGNFERWGDYSGSQRRYNNKGEVWISGFMGFRNNFATSKDQHKTFIAKLSSPDKTQTSIVSQQASQIKAFPQPFTEQFSFEFEINQAQVLHFALLDMKGAWMQDLLTKEVKKGKNAFLFENAGLSPGLYFLQVSNTQGRVLFTHKIMKQ